MERELSVSAPKLNGCVDGNRPSANMPSSASTVPPLLQPLAQPNTESQPSSITMMPLSSANIIPTTPTLELNDDDDKGHVNETEKIIEFGGPSNRYGKLNTILGKGAYKVVWKAVDREEGIEVAWNCLQTTKSEFNELSQEIEILKRVRHPNIITFHDSWYCNGEFIFITELMTSGTLREYIRKLRNPNMKIIRRWARQILKGLQYLHGQSPPIIHRDIKCDNLFINGAHGEVKIGDMGTAKMKFGKKYTVIGTPEFMAPEMYEEKGYSEKVDIYAFGMCLLEMVTGDYPYSECKNAAQIYKKVSQGIKPECLNLVEDKEVLMLINSCLAGENERWSAKRLLEHSFLSEDPDLVLLGYDDTKTQLQLQLVHKGQDMHSIKFEFNVQNDTPEDVVKEMIEEDILPAKFMLLVISEIRRVLRDLKRLPSGERASETTSTTTSGTTEIRDPFDRRAAEYEAGIRSHDPDRNVTKVVLSDVLAKSVMESPGIQSSILEPLSARRTSNGSNAEVKTLENFDFEPPTRDYPSEFPIDEFVHEVAINAQRGAEKANEWLVKLKSQDIMTVGDLRDLIDEDWTHLNLTVFASRALRNGLMGKGRSVAVAVAAVLSPRATSVVQSTTTPVPIIKNGPIITTNEN